MLTKSPEITSTIDWGSKLRLLGLWMLCHFGTVVLVFLFNDYFYDYFSLRGLLVALGLSVIWPLVVVPYMLTGCNLALNLVVIGLSYFGYIFCLARFFIANRNIVRITSLVALLGMAAISAYCILCLRD